MAQDPAFLFYTNDFERGVQFFSDEQVGMYLRLLMAQHQHGHLTEKQMRFICKSYDNDVIGKFTKDENGLFFNERLELEINRRKSYIDSRSKNKSGKIKELHKDEPKIISKSYDNHMEDENEIENVIKIKKEKGVQGEKAKSEKELSAIRVMEYFNQATGKRLGVENRAYLSNILARFREGRTEQGLCDIIDLKIMEWKGKEHEKYLHPDTLFAAKHSQRYYDEVEAAREGRITVAQIKGGKIKKDAKTLSDESMALYKQRKNAGII